MFQQLDWIPRPGEPIVKRMSPQAATKTPLLSRIIIATAIAVVLSAAPLLALGVNKRSLDMALMLTGRWGFLLFLPAYAGAGLTMLLGGRLGFLRRRGREFGLAFAAIMLVHLTLIAWLCAIGHAPEAGVFLFFGPAILLLYMLALFSLTGMHRHLGRRSWWLLRNGAMTYIAYAFAVDFLRDALNPSPRHLALYAPFALLSLLGFAAYASALLLRARTAVLGRLPCAGNGRRLTRAEKRRVLF